MLIQRLGDTQTDEQFIDLFIKTAKQNPGAVDGVWLGALYGYPTLKTHKSHAVALSEVAKKFRRENIDVSLQISNTIGHGIYMSSRDCSALVYDGSPVEYMVGHDGTETKYSFCWRGKHFQSYILEMIKIYANATQPSVVWIDDDFRAQNHHPVSLGCFCDNCIMLFNEQYGTNFTREELVEAINYGAPVWRERHVAFLREGLESFAYEMAKAVHEVSPHSTMGYEYCCNGGFTGFGYEHVFDAFYKGTGHVPQSRPGGGSYNDHNPNAFIDKMQMLNLQNSMLPDYVTDILPEIESLPNIQYGKSIAGTMFETSLYFAAGSTGMTYAIMQNNRDDINWHMEMLKTFAVHRPYWDLLIDYNKNTLPSGLDIVMSHSMWKKQYKREEGLFRYDFEPVSAGYELLGPGLPISRGGYKDDVKLLHFKNTQLLTDEEIKDLLSKNVITDGATIAYLTKKGYSFSIDAEPVDLTTLQEQFCDHPINSDFTHQAWHKPFLVTEGHKLCKKTDKTEVFSVYTTKVASASGNDLGIAGAITETEAGAKWAVFGNYLWSNLLSSYKRNQIANAVDYISNNALCAYMKTTSQCMVFPRVEKRGKVCAVSVLNNTVGNSGALELLIRNPLSEHFFLMGLNCEKQKLAFKKEGNDYIVTIPDVAPWSIVTVFAEM